MAVPDFQALMLPLLQVAADGKEHSLAEARDKLAAQFKLTGDDLAELLPSGKQAKFSNRVAWAKTYLQQAGLLVSTRRAHFQISSRGNDVLKRRLAFTTQQLKVSSNLEETVKQRLFHVAFARAVMEEQTRVMADAGDTRSHVGNVERQSRSHD